MATKSEINGWIESARKKVDRYQQTIDSCNKQIARLEPVYRKLGDIKADFHSARKSTEEVFDRKDSWRGDKHTSFRQAGDALDGTCGEYYQRLDAAQDAVNKKIGELRAKKRELVPLVGDLLAQVAEWRVDIENALN